MENSKLLYVQVYEMIIAMIVDGRLPLGQAVPSENAMSNQLKISRMTVRKAYSKLVEQGILMRQHGKQTYVNPQVDPASLCLQLPTYMDGKKTIGVIFPELTIFFPKILASIEEMATTRNYVLNVITNNSYEKEKNALDTMLKNKVDGIIITPFRSGEGPGLDNYERLIQIDIPFIMVGRPPFQLNCDAVYCDDTYASFEAVNHFIHSGHRKILYLYHSYSDQQANRERMDGYKRAVAEANIEPICLNMGEPGWEDTFYALINESSPVTAIFASEDALAADICTIILSMGRQIPQDIEIIGYDNSDICIRMPIKLSSVDQPKRDIGYYAFELLEHRILPSSEKCTSGLSHRILLPSLIIRDSCR